MFNVQLKNLTIGYKGNVIASDVSAELQSGKLTCLLGVNGCGKSTLLRTMCGFLPPLDGEILIEGENLNHLTAAEKSRKISIVLTHNDGIRGMTVWDVVAMGRSPYTGFWGHLSDEDKKIIRDSLAMVGIEQSAMLHRRITEISDGERQKVMIAKAIAQQTPVILLDEPTAFLDYPSKRRMFKLLTQVARDLNKAILLSTHDIDHAKRFGDEAWMMDKRQLRCSSFKELIAEKPDFFLSEEE
jgi:iron complex transport system ATP-binding protein